MMLAVCLFLALFVLVVWGIRRRVCAPGEVRLALERAGYEVVKMEYRWLRLGPFSPWTTSRSQYVFHVVVRDAGGRQRTVWARWGSKWLFYPDELQLQWED